MPKGKGYGGKQGDAHREAKIPTKGKEGTDSEHANGCDTAGFGGDPLYNVNQTKGCENKAPTSGGGR
jgi:hypothetical protein